MLLYNEYYRFNYLFPRFSKHLNGILDEFSFNINNDTDIERVCYVVEASLMKVIETNDSNELHSTCLLILEDIIELKSFSNNLTHKVNCNFLQIFTCMLPIKFGLYTSMLQITHDWIIYSISDQVPYETHQEFEPTRFVECEEFGNDYIKGTINAIIVEWLGYYFFYSFRTGGLRDLAILISDYTLKLISQWYSEVYTGIKKIDPMSVEMIIHFSSLMYIVDKDICKQSVIVLENLLTLPQVDKLILSRIKQQLSCAPGQLSSKPTHEWAEEVLLEPENVLDELGKIKILINSYNYDINKAIEKQDLLISTIDQFILSNSKKDDYTKLYLIARTFDLLQIPITLFIKNGYYEATKRILSSWYNVPDFERKILFCLPNQSEAPLFAMENGPVVINQWKEDSFRKLVELTNDFLSRNITVSNDACFEMKQYPRHGVPDIELSHDFELKLYQFYRFDELLKHEEVIGSIGEALLVIPNLQHPIQALMLKYSNFTLPISASFRTPLIDRKIKKVLLWSISSITSSLESDALKKIFTKADIEVDYYDSEISKEEFLTKYRSSEFDAVWIISHGNYNHYYPHASDITTNDEKLPIFIKDLSDVQLTDYERRLLVLNICDGGTSAAFGNPNDFGIAPSVTHEYQATISHIWPTDSWFAAIFGILLSIGLVNSNSYFEGYMYALKYLQSSKSEVIIELEKYLDHADELLNILKTKNLDFEKIYYWGSPVFYE